MAAALAAVIRLRGILFGRGNDGRCLISCKAVYIPQLHVVALILLGASVYAMGLAYFERPHVIEAWNLTVRKRAEKSEIITNVFKDANKRLI